MTGEVVGRGRPPRDLVGFKLPGSCLRPAKRVVKNGKPVWKCKCLGGGPGCKGVCYLPAGAITSGNTKSCGCLARQNMIDIGLATRKIKDPAEALRMQKKGMTVTQIAKHFDVSMRCVQRTIKKAVADAARK